MEGRESTQPEHHKPLAEPTCDETVLATQTFYGECEDEGYCDNFDYSVDPGGEQTAGRAG